MELETLRDKLEKRPSPFLPEDQGGAPFDPRSESRAKGSRVAAAGRPGLQIGFVGDRDIVSLKTIRYEDHRSSGAGCEGIIDIENDLCIPLPGWAIRSGPRRNIYFEPRKVTAAIVTCGGLCPGLNDIIQNIVYMLLDYGVPDERILGVRYGLRGFTDRSSPPVPLDRRAVDGIHLRGGTILGTSRGNADVPEIVSRLDLWGVNMLFVLGGNGGNAAAEAINRECREKGVDCAVVAVPKSIDNDILVIDKTFGFETAVQEAQGAIMAAKVEAMSAYRGVGVVRLMGRQSGFVAMNASLASGVVDVCLIPELDFSLDRVLKYVERVVDERGHCVLCVAEGAGQDVMRALAQDEAATGKMAAETDASGNPILQDFGVHLRKQIKKHVPAVDVKYIDPSYMIRSIPTVTQDRIYCTTLAQGAVHAAFAAYTGITVGLVNTHFCFLPIGVVIQAPRLVDPCGRQWSRLVMANGQPDLSDRGCGPCAEEKDCAESVSAESAVAAPGTGSGE